MNKFSIHSVIKLFYKMSLNIVFNLLLII